MVPRVGLAAFSALSFACATSGGARMPDPALGGFESRMQALEQELEATRRELADVRNGAKTGDTDRQAQWDGALRELALLRKELDEQARRLEALGSSVAQLRADDETRYASPRAASAPASGPGRRKQAVVARTPAASTTPTPNATDTLPTTLSPDQTEVFTLARDEEAKGERSVAREVYQHYVEKWPRDPNTAEIHFRLGELAFDDKNYTEAIGEYGTVARDFPSSPRTPDALLRTAEAMNKLDLRDDGEQVLMELVKRYPNSAAAARASAQLAGSSPDRKLPR